MLNTLLLVHYVRFESWLESVPLLALTPAERWQAARRLSPKGLISEEWFTMALIAVLTVMLLILGKVTYNRIMDDRKVGDQQFIDNVRRHNLSVQEYQLLQDILKESGLRRRNHIFRSQPAFDRGAKRLLSQADTKTPDIAPRLRGEINFLRAKLGVNVSETPKETTEETSAGKPGKRRLSSQDLPMGKSLFITRRLEGHNDDIQGTIVENTQEQLVISIEHAVKISFGEVWRARYYFGASVWEFDTSVISYDGDRLVLKHCDNVKFVNRRRFLRVPTHCRALIAAFPFNTTTHSEADATWDPLHFSPATVTELAGPGLRVESELEASIGDRVLVVFLIESADAPGTALQTIQDISIVRRIEPIFERFALSLELTGVTDHEIDILVRLTNQAALTPEREDSEESDTLDSAHGEIDAVLEAVIESEEVLDG
ncbi:hypothetical protein ACFL3F_01380 [Planctomycetota bacterium]